MDEALLMTGDELVERIGARATYDLVVALDRRGKAIAHYPGRPGRRSQDKALRKRNIEILRLRIVEHRTHGEVAKAVGLSKPRIPQILHIYFGVNKGARRVSSVKIPVEALAVVRESLRMRLLAMMQDLCACITAGAGLEWESFDLMRAVLADVEGVDDDVEIASLGRKRGVALAEALRRQLDIERYLTDTPDEGQRERHSADAAMIERLLSAMQL
jgi:hypothetical protein